MFTSPACAQTIVGSSVSRSSSVSMRPFESAPTMSVGAPSPSMRSARSIVPWRFSPTTTRIRGAPVSPSRSTSQPVCFSTWWRAAASAVNVAVCAPGHEAERRVPRQPEQLDQPRAGDLLDDGGGRASDVEAGVLIPCRGQPVGRDRHRHRAADHETEVAAARLRDEPGIGGRGQLLDHLRRGRRPLGQRRGEARAHLVHRRAREDGAVVERVVEARSELGGLCEEGTQVVHAFDPSSRIACCAWRFRSTGGA